MIVSEPTKNLVRVDLGIHDRGRIAAESLAFARYAMYGAVYWHRTHRAAKAMLNRIAHGALATWSARGERYKQELQASLYEEIRRRQETLPYAESQSSSPYVDARSEALLRWLQEQTDPAAKPLVDEILKRQLFARALVCARGRPGSEFTDDDWEDIGKLYGKLGARWKDRLEANAVLTRRVAEAVGSWRGEISYPGSTVTVEVRDRFLRVANERTVVLLDYPPAKPGSSSQLKYIRETEWSEATVDALSVDNVEDSPVWAALHGKGSAQPAKLRVFCHPEFGGLLKQAIVSRKEFETIVLEAIREVID